MGLRIAGKLPSGKYLERLKTSPNYKSKGFENLSPTPMLADDASYWTMLRDFFRRHEYKVPPAAIPSVKTDLKHSLPQPSLVWFGHSSYLLKVNDHTVLVDPVLSGSASPVRFMIRAFAGTDVYTVADLPAIDYLVLTHDHYDHLDFKTILQLKSKVKNVYCSLGVGSHLEYWGYDSRHIVELDWWESREPEPGFQITAAPARHFSGRGIRRGQSLWSSFIIRTDNCNLYLGGDSGYDHHFKDIGERFGPFDLAILECGQYNEMWPLIHMMPEETVQASIDLKARVLMPVHWGKFSLAMHPWNEPVRRSRAAAIAMGVDIRFPKIGQPLLFRESDRTELWWGLGSPV